MTANASNRRIFVFGPFHLDPAEPSLSCRGKAVHVGPKVLDTLILLAENSGRIVSKDEIIEQIWDGAFVEENSLSQNIFLLRKALKKGVAGEEFIETVSKRGYRFAAGKLTLTYAPIDKVARVAEVRNNRPEIRSLAVMPFAYLGDAQNGDKCLGLAMAEAATVRLSGLRQFSVIPTRTMLKYAERPDDLRTAARECGVDAVLEGSIQRSGERIRATVQLISSSDGVCIWSGSFDENARDIFSMQDSLAERLGAELDLRLNGSEKRTRKNRRSNNPAAYQSYLVGFHFANRRTKEALLKSIDYFSESARLDPGYAAAYAGIADSSFWLAYSSSDLKFRQQSFEKSRDNAVKAIDLDSSLAEAHAALATVKVKHDRDTDGADRVFQTALAANAGCSMAYSRYAYFLAAMGRTEEALRTIRRSQELDPLSPDANASLAMVLSFLGRYDEAERYCEIALALEPNFTEAHILLGRCYEQRAMFGESEAAYRRAYENDNDVEGLELLAHLYAVTDRKTDARNAISKLLSAKSPERVRPYNIAAVYAALGERSHALDWLKKPYLNWTERLRMLHHDPRLDCLRKDARFERHLSIS